VALQDLGRFARSRFTGPVVGLTGSSGKTTTRAFTALALSPLGPVHQTVGNLNNHLGVPMTLCAVEPEARAMVVEMGTSSPGEIGFLAELATPDIRLIVNVGPAHLQELGGLDGVAVEKGAIFATARPGDVLVKNMADPRVAALPVPAGVRVVTVGTRDSDVRVVATASTEALGMRVMFATPEGEFA
ncbi:MAG: UDP-N-acetylmuramoyl-tripeptide--D-alanyl-D-alanine ligase, partial [Myxococcales bacterium]|nr:UDP-N-acetylmuramoyl-tripeptide--D-alanyl-D-alanine ligase [Myxococcales bacterium]